MAQYEPIRINAAVVLLRSSRGSFNMYRLAGTEILIFLGWVDLSFGKSSEIA